jgi:hypothetical protein
MKPSQSPTKAALSREAEAPQLREAACGNASSNQR